MLDKLRAAWEELEDQLGEFESRISCDCPPPVCSHAAEDRYGRVVYLCNDCGGPIVASKPATGQAEALQFIAQQFCQYSDTMPCTQTGKCVTEYCYPCYAKAHV